MIDLQTFNFLGIQQLREEFMKERSANENDRYSSFDFGESKVEALE